MGFCVNILMNSFTVTQAVGISFKQEYAERYNWLARQFKDLACSSCPSFL